MKYTKEQLVKAMKQYNSEYLNNTEEFTEIDNSIECAETQIDKLLSFVK